MLAFVNGCFDLLHVGHVRLLEWAAMFGELHVAINSDESVRVLKGPGRPVYIADERREMLLALRCVSQVHVFGELTPGRIIADVCPDVIVVGYDHSPGDPHYVDAEIRGARLVQAPRFSKRSSTQVVRLTPA